MAFIKREEGHPVTLNQLRKHIYNKKKPKPLCPGENYWAPVWNNSFDKELIWVQIGGDKVGKGVNDDSFPIQMAEDYSIDYDIAAVYWTTGYGKSIDPGPNLETISK